MRNNNNLNINIPLRNTNNRIVFNPDSNNNFKYSPTKKIQNDNKMNKKAFLPYRFQTENDANSVLIKRDNILNRKKNKINNNNNNVIINSKSSIDINRNKNNYTINRKNNSGYDLRSVEPLFVEIPPKIVSSGNNTTTNSIANSDNFIGLNNRKNSNRKEYNNLGNIYKTDDLEMTLEDNNKVNRINKYKMIRYKGN